MRTSLAVDRYHGLKSILKVFLCAVLTISLCPPFTNAFADEPTDAEVQATAIEETPEVEAAAADDESNGDAIEVLEDTDTIEIEPEETDSVEATDPIEDESSSSASEEPGEGIDEGTPEEETVPDEEATSEEEPLEEQDPEKADEQKDAVELTFDNEELHASVTAPAGTLPEDGALEVEEILPRDYDSAEAYAGALTSLSEKLGEDDLAYSDARMFDIRVLNAAGEEIEPNGQVQVNIEYKKDLELFGAERNAENVEVAHLDNEGDVKLMGAEVEGAGEDAVKATSFETDGFSYYIVFGTHEGDDSEPLDIGDYGWLKFTTHGKQDTTPLQNDPTANWGHYTDESTLPALNSEEGYHRILKVNLHTLIPGRDESVYDDNNYELNSTNQYFWTWENQIFISDFYVPDFEVVQVKSHQAWDSEELDKWGASLVGPYSVRGYRSADGTDEDFNVIDVYMKPVQHAPDAMRYIVRYVHADGSVVDGNVRYLSNGRVDLNIDQPYGNERFSGVSVVAGNEAITVNGTSVRINYDPNVNLAKVYVYFEEKDEPNTTQVRDQRFDKVNGQYYTGAVDLYTDKSAEEVEGKDREFLVNLESWYVDHPAYVGMILDASGSMVWTAGEPTPLDVDALLEGVNPGVRNRILRSSMQNPISANDLRWLLDTTAVDNTNLGYNTYEYFVRTETADSTNPISEWTPLGYSDGQVSNDRLVLGNTVNGVKQVEGYASSQNYAGAGWYYVNPSTNTGAYGAYGSKRFEGIPASHMNNLGLGWQNSAARFWVEVVDGRHVLRCLFNCGNAADPVNRDGWGPTTVGPGTQISTVYYKRDQMMTKQETLQDAISQFGAILNGASPLSEVAISRFSHTNFTNLNLLNWTNESEKIASALDILKNSPYYNGNSTKTDGTYQYVITGGTVARMGFENFSQVHKAHSDQGQNSKYIILFTDGKDQGVSRNRPLTRQWLEQNGYGDYTIITMFMQSVGMTETDVNEATTFLEGLASGGKGGVESEKLFFNATSEDPHEVVEQFREIANHIITGLRDYSVRDYIDPRFDVVNEAGQVLSVLDENGEFKTETNPDVDAHGLRGFTTPDGKQAMLGYDNEKKMFFVMWQHQDIPATALGGTTVMPWKSQIRLTAKADFIGGNDVLTNGNGPTDDLVYKPVLELKPDGTPVLDENGKTIPQYGPSGAEIVDTEETSKSFPYASVNPGMLDVALGNYEDTVFLGDEITPGDLLSLMMGTDTKLEDRADTMNRVADTVYNESAIGGEGGPDPDMSSKYYVEYLERLGVKLHNGNKNFYYTLLQHTDLTSENGVEALIAAMKADNNYTVTEAPGQVIIEGKDNTLPAGEKITITKSGANASIKLEVPYYYLESPTDGSSYAGPTTDGVDPNDDKVGTLTYEWKCVDFAGNIDPLDTKDEGNRFVQFDTYVDKDNHMITGAPADYPTTPVQYQFSIRYDPLALTDDAKTDGARVPSDGDGSERTRALTGLTNRDDAKIRNNVCTERFLVEGEQSTTDQMGWAVIHAVDGRILIQKKMLKEDYEEALANMPNASMTFVLTGTAITSAGEDEVVWTYDLPLPSQPVSEEGDYVYLMFEWATGLPKGVFTLTESTSGGLVLKSIEPIEEVKFWPYPVVPGDGDPDDPAKPYDGTDADWGSVASGASWEIGLTPKKDTSNFLDTTFAYGDAGSFENSVKYDMEVGGYPTPKNIDPHLNGSNEKAYLNAQLGRAEVLNGLQRTSIEVRKVWQIGDPTDPEAPFVVKLVGTDGSERYAELNAGNGWSYTFEELNINSTVYSVVEGTGTVDEDGNCPDFAPFDEQFEYGGKTYKRVSIVYEGEDGNATDAGIEASVPDKAGTATITNCELTKVAVQKVWEGITPNEGIVIRLNSTGEDPRYAELNAGNSWSYTFEELPVAEGRVYSIEEGTGDVAQDGTCSNWSPFPTSGNFTFDGITYRMKEPVTYTPAGAQSGSTTPLDCVAPDSGTAVVGNEALTRFEVQKIWAEGADPGSESIVVELAGTDGSKLYTTFSASQTSYSFEGLKVTEGLTYTVTEGTGTVNPDGTCNDFSPFGDTFELNGQTMALLNVKYYADEEGTVAAENLSQEVSPYGGKAVLTNGPAGADLALQKVDAEDESIVVSGVSFELYKGDEFATAELEDTYTTNGDGSIDFGKLVPGTFWLVETDAPVGYTIRPADEPIKITVSTTAEVTLEDTYTQAPARLEGPDDDGLYTLVVPNERAYLLPAAGGMGIFEFLFLGAFVMVFAAGMVLNRRKTPSAMAHAASAIKRR